MCLRQSADLHMTQLMPLPLTISCNSKSRLVYFSGFTFLVLAKPVVLDKIQDGCKTVVCVCVWYWVRWLQSGWKILLGNIHYYFAYQQFFLILCLYAKLFKFQTHVSEKPIMIWELIQLQQWMLRLTRYELLLKVFFWVSHGTVATFYKWDGQVCKSLMWIFQDSFPKIIKIGLVLAKVFNEDRDDVFFQTLCVCS